MHCFPLYPLEDSYEAEWSEVRNTIFPEYIDGFRESKFASNILMETGYFIIVFLHGKNVPYIFID